MPADIYASSVIGGLSFGGAATLFQTASAKATGDSAELAQSMIVTVCNIGIAGGGIVGGLVLSHWNVTMSPWALLLILAAGLGVALRPTNRFQA